MSKWVAAGATSTLTPETFGAKGDGSTNDTAALVAAMQAASSTRRPLVLTRRYAFTSISQTLDDVAMSWLPGAELVCTLNKTVDTIPFQLTGSRIHLHNPSMTFSTTLNVDTDGASRPANADAFRLGGTSTGALADDIRVTGGRVSYARNSGLRIRYATRVRVRAFEVYEALGNGIMLETCQNARIVDCVTDRTGDDGVVVLASSANYLAGLSRNITVVGNAIRRSYANGINFTGVSCGMIASNLIDTTWAAGIHVWQDSTFGFGTNDNIAIAPNTIRSAGKNFGAGQYKTSVYTGSPVAISIDGDPTNVTLMPQNISNSQGGDYALLSGTVTDLRATATPVRSSTGNYIYTLGVTATTTAVVAGELTYVPIVVPATVTTIDLVISCITAAAGSTVRLGIYTNANGGPKKLIAEADAVVDTSTTGTKSATITQVLPPGTYWLAAVAQGGAPSLRTLVGRPQGLTGNGDPGQSISGWKQTGVTGALPSTASTTGVSTAGIAVNLHI